MSLASMYESYFLAYTFSRIQSGLDNFDEWRLVMASLTNLGVKGILCGFILVPECKAGSLFRIRDLYTNSNLDPPTTFSTSSTVTKFEDIFP